jgi:hypothetical protein
MADLARADRRWAAAIAVVALVSVWVQLLVTGRFDGFLEWLRPLTLIAVGAALVAVAVACRRDSPMRAALGAVVAALLLLPAGWSAYEATHASLNATLPQAGPREGPAGRTFGSVAFDRPEVRLGAWLRNNREPGARWDLAVAGAQTASSLIARDGLSVMALGGFSGRDPTLTIPAFAGLVERGDVRYVYGVAGRPRPSGAGGRAIIPAAAAVCPLVVDRWLSPRYWGMLYDCRDRGQALRAYP